MEVSISFSFQLLVGTSIDRLCTNFVDKLKALFRYSSNGDLCLNVCHSLKLVFLGELLHAPENVQSFDKLELI